MKKLNLFLGALVTIFFISCEGPQGPPGYDGFDGIDGADGQDGINILGKVMDIEGSFTLQNDYSIFYEFPQTVEVFETDVVLVYLLWDETVDGNGDLVDIWRLMPQTRILDQGLLQYNFDYTFFDVNIFLESDFDLSTLPAGDTDNQIFRIAVLPAESTTGKLDTSDINSVMAHLGVKEENIQKIKLD
ncbi:collagen-like protein [uncultured Maribacter sp.]|uniref:collagen-like triple helix repeat-containing protein n=1 Tax=uncultured Maribacter sp. TaxID=431308 RepID=UPI0030D7BFE4|tara:strand:+ start:9312 stop:9875 length:564 start_codon:yes stop_codon:yes gene_type:complete